MRRGTPKIQNLPLRTKTGREIRDAFLPERPLFTNVDYEELEMRIAAALEEFEKPKRRGE